MPEKYPSNEEIADLLEAIAGLLETQGANEFRVAAYRRGASTIRDLDRPAARLVEEGGQEALEDLPEIGSSLAGLTVEYVHTGRSDLLARLQGEVDPASLFARVPGVGEELAGRIAEQLDIHTLEELEMAAHDGRLEKVPGFGPRRVQAVRDGLAGMLSRAARRRVERAEAGRDPDVAEERPPVALLLDVDAEYRRKAAAGELQTIAPKRFNPSGEAWLPILHTDRKGWSFTALFSNTKLAHQLGKTDDWVVIYYRRSGAEAQNTVVTETSGPLAGQRVVRGREAETREYYQEAGEG